MSVPTTTPSPPRLFARNTCDWVYLMTERGRGRGVCRFLAAGLEVSAVKSVSNLPYSPPGYPPPPRFFARNTRDWVYLLILVCRREACCH
jgi:hypothetical protein